MTGQDHPKPQIEVESDYDHYFQNLVESMVESKKGEFKHDKIVVSSGPYRPSALTYRSKDKIIYLDFYSAIRNGFGSLSNQDITDITDLL